MLFDRAGEISRLRHREPMVAQVIIALQRRAYRPEAELLQFPDLPPLKESPAQIMASKETFFGLTVRSRLVAIAAIEATTYGTRISRLCVAPESTRRGYAARLIRHVLATAEPPIHVTTGERNQPALALYARLGFAVEGRHRSKEGLALVTLRRDPQASAGGESDGD